MAIHIENPNSIGDQILDMYNITNGTGQNLIKDFETRIESLKGNWQGTDAVANLKDLAMVYADSTKLVKNLQKIISEVNNNEIIPLQKHIVLSGGTCKVSETLSPGMNVSDAVSVPQSATASMTKEAIVQDAELFNDFPTRFSRFVESLKSAVQTLLSNWKEGANRDSVNQAFKAFESNAPEYIRQLETVRNNLNTVAENKKKLM